MSDNLIPVYAGKYIDGINDFKYDVLWPKLEYDTESSDLLNELKNIMSSLNGGNDFEALKDKLIKSFEKAYDCLRQEKSKGEDWDKIVKEIDSRIEDIDAF